MFRKNLNGEYLNKEQIAKTIGLEENQSIESRLEDLLPYITSLRADKIERAINTEQKELRVKESKLKEIEDQAIEDVDKDVELLKNRNEYKNVVLENVKGKSYKQLEGAELKKVNAAIQEAQGYQILKGKRTKRSLSPLAEQYLKSVRSYDKTKNSLESKLAALNQLKLSELKISDVKKMYVSDLEKAFKLYEAGEKFKAAEKTLEDTTITLKQYAGKEGMSAISDLIKSRTINTDNKFPSDGKEFWGLMRNEFSKDWESVTVFELLDYIDRYPTELRKSSKEIEASNIIHEALDKAEGNFVEKDFSGIDANETGIGSLKSSFRKHYIEGSEVGIIDVKDVLENKIKNFKDFERKELKQEIFDSKVYQDNKGSLKANDTGAIINNMIKFDKFSSRATIDKTKEKINEIDSKIEKLKPKTLLVGKAGQAVKKKAIKEIEALELEKQSLTSFHSNYQCSMRGMIHTESFKIIRGYN